MVPPANVGPASIPDYESVATEAVYDLGGGVTAFAGPRDDPFFVELGGIFDLLTFARTLPGSAGDGVDGLGGFNVMTIAVQVPIADITDGEQPVIGVWTTAARRQVTIKYPQTEVHAGKFVQVSRLGSPLVNEVVIPMGKKDKFNSSAPKFDAQFSVEEIIGKLREAEVALAQGETVAQACRGIGVSDHTFYRWRQQYGG